MDDGVNINPMDGLHVDRRDHDIAVLEADM